MARGLIVEIIGDDRSLQNAFKRAGRAASKFSSDMNRRLGGGVSVADQFSPILGDTRRMQAQADELTGRLHNMDAGLAGAGRSANDLSGGLGKVAVRAGLAGIAISTAYHAGRRLSEALETTGSEAFTTTGRIRNLGSALISGDIVGGIAALRRLPQSLDEAGISAGEAFAKFDQFKRLAGAGGPWGKLAQQAVDLVEETRAAEAAVDALADSVARLGTTFRTSTGQVVTFKGAVDDLGGLRGPGLVDQINLNLAAQAGPTSNRIARPIGPTAKNAAAQIIAQATGDLDELLRLQRIERDRLQKAIANSTGNVHQREALNTQLAQARAAVISTQKTIAADAAARKKAGADAAKTKTLDLWARIIQNLSIGVSRAELTSQLNDDLAALNALRAGLQRQIRAGVDVSTAQSQLVGVTAQIAAKQADIAANVQELTQARQFRALGLSATGEEIVPGIANLSKRINSALQQVTAGTLNVSSKIAQRLRLARNLIRREGKLLTEETRSTINDLIKTANQGIDRAAAGPRTKTTTLSTKILEGLGLSRDEEKELRARLSRFNSAGIASGVNRRGQGGLAIVGAGGGAPIVVNTTVELDGQKVGQSTKRFLANDRRHNPPQKRGPNAG